MKLSKLIRTLLFFLMFISMSFGALPTYVSIDGNEKLIIIRQPSDDDSWVSSGEKIVTNFNMVERYGSVGLLAHNFLIGKTFSDADIGENIILYLPDGSIQTYQVTEVRLYQALTPNSIYSDFLDLNDRSIILDNNTLFAEVYGVSGRLVLQTCITWNYIASWGRIFIIAERIS